MSPLFKLLSLTFLFLSSTSTTSTKTIYDFTLPDIEGNQVNFNDFRGKALLLLPTASQCSQTDSQFRSLKRLHDILSYTNKLEILAFPCNDFGEQEPWEEEEIKEFVRGHFKADGFRLFKKTKILSKEEREPIWDWVIETTSTVPSWNFHKYLFNTRGEFVRAWPSETSIEEIFEAVRSAVDDETSSTEGKKTTEKVGEKKKKSEL